MVKLNENFCARTQLRIKRTTLAANNKPRVNQTSNYQSSIVFAYRSHANILSRRIFLVLKRQWFPVCPPNASRNSFLQLFFYYSYNSFRALSYRCRLADICLDSIYNLRGLTITDQRRLKRKLDRRNDVTRHPRAMRGSLNCKRHARIEIGFTFLRMFGIKPKPIMITHLLHPQQL